MNWLAPFSEVANNIYRAVAGHCQEEAMSEAISEREALREDLATFNYRHCPECWAIFSRRWPLLRNGPPTTKYMNSTAARN